MQFYGLRKEILSCLIPTNKMTYFCHKLYYLAITMGTIKSSNEINTLTYHRFFGLLLRPCVTSGTKISKSFRGDHVILIMQHLKYLPQRYHTHLCFEVSWHLFMILLN